MSSRSSSVLETLAATPLRALARTDLHVISFARMRFRKANIPCVSCVRACGMLWF